MRSENKYELIKFEDGDFSLDVNVSPNEETVWLNRIELSMLFDRDVKTIGKHINNILKEEYMNVTGVIAKIATTATDGKTYMVEYYNLDIILSVGYRVKSQRGVLFRRWANTILKQYLLCGQVINETRCMAHSDNLIKLSNTVDAMSIRLDNFEFKLASITSSTYFKDKIFYNGELFEGYSFIKNLFNTANNRIIIIDSYLDYSVLEMMNNITIDITIYIASHTPITNREISLFKTNHTLNVIRTNNFHDRFIIIDDELYSVGSSIKDIGKKISHVSKLDSISIDDLLNRYI
jgi:hypothetical protein